MVGPGAPPPSRKTGVTNALGVLISPLFVVSKNAIRCSPTSRTVVANTGVMAVGSVGTEVGCGAAVGVAEELQATATAMTKVANAGISSRVLRILDANIPIILFMVLSRKRRM